MASNGPFKHILGTENEHDFLDTTGYINKARILSAMSRYGAQFGVVIAAELRGLNGSRCYGDVSEKLEYAGPECTNGTDAMYYEMAGSMFWALMALRAGQWLRHPVPWIIKTNTSARANSGGGNHINLSMPGKKEDYDKNLGIMMDYLKAFLVSLQLISGSGLVVPKERATTRLGTDAYGYAISPRAFHVEKNKGTANNSRDNGEKPIFLSRSETLADDKRFWRLQICGLDSNILPTALRIKLDLILLITEMATQGELDPVILVDTYGKDTHSSPLTSRNWRVHLDTSSGRTLTPLQIQWSYFNQAQAYVNRHPNPNRQWLLNEWAGLLTAFITDDDIPRSLVGKVDWVTKAVMLEQAANRLGRPLTYEEAEERHFLYHSYRFVPGRLCTPVRLLRLYGEPGALSRVWRSLYQPPSDTRASARGRFIATKPKNAKIDWHLLKVGEIKVKLPNPLAPTTPWFEQFMLDIQESA